MSLPLRICGTRFIFFFVDYQGTRMKQAVDPGLIAVPSALNRTGDLLDQASSLTGLVNGQSWADLLTQKLGYTVTPGESYYTKGCIGRTSRCFTFVSGRS